MIPRTVSCGCSLAVIMPESTEVAQPQGVSWPWWGLTPTFPSLLFSKKQGNELNAGGSDPR